VPVGAGAIFSFPVKQFTVGSVEQITLDAKVSATLPAGPADAGWIVVKNGLSGLIDAFAGVLGFLHVARGGPVFEWFSQRIEALGLRDKINDIKDILLASSAEWQVALIRAQFKADNVGEAIRVAVKNGVPADRATQIISKGISDALSAQFEYSSVLTEKDVRDIVG
ncbi:MAG: hypothetical protein ACP5KA_07720, partial [Desulfurococcaceae archaeon]